MKIQEIITGILEYHPDIGDRKTCDVIIGSDQNANCTGMVVSIAPTVEVIRVAIDLGANFILVHEPAFYSAYDDESEWLKGNEVYEDKLRLILDNGIVIYRDHDHIHAHNPDGIFHYVLKQLGWSDYVVPGVGMAPSVKLPETTLGELIQHVKNAMNLKTIRYIGNPEARVSTVNFCGHLLPHAGSNWSNNDQVAAAWDHDVIIPGESVEWTLPLYIQDAAMLGKAKGLILPGHFIQEEAGMRWAEVWLRPIVGDDLPITFISAGEMFKHM